jgi:hypothetical protein
MRIVIMICLLTDWVVSEGIALRLRRPTSSRKYLYTQIFAGLSYIVASGFMFQLRRMKLRQKSLAQ